MSAISAEKGSGEKDFAVVCDCGCDLVSSLAEERGAACLSFGGPADEARGGMGSAGAAGGSDAARSALATAYCSLAEKGFSKIVSVHSTETFSDTVAAARTAADEVSALAHVEVVDTGTASVATGMVVERLCVARAAGWGFDEAVTAARAFAPRVRMLMVPASSARFHRRRGRASSAGLLRRATASLRVRLSSERALYLLVRGEATQLARSTDLVELTSRLVHAMSALAANEGTIVYAKLDGGDSRALHAVEKPLDTNEFESRCLGTVPMGPLTLSVAGTGTVGVAVAPAAVFDAFGQKAYDAAAFGREGS